MGTLTADEGRLAVSLAREAIGVYLREKRRITPHELPSVFDERRGVFVTLNSIEEGGNELRGCIGFPYPTYPLKEAVREAAIGAATSDPRFLPVSSSEMEERIVVELTVLTEPTILRCSPPERIDHIEIGRHGLIVRYGHYQGLLLPQVASEHGMDREEFLCHTCLKAGLSQDMWLDENTEVYTFEGQIFEESEPGGEVIQKDARGASP
ncbi:MAG: TIGR00296 family protein [Methermicoccaceae archaeon]